MMDPGWDVPGISRDEPPGAAAPSVAGARESHSKRKRGGKGRAAASVSALGGSSAGAFARPGGGTGPSRDGASSSATPSSCWQASASSPPSLSSLLAPSPPDSAPPPAASSPGASLPVGSSAADPGSAAMSDSAGCGAGPQSAAEALRSLSAALEFLARDDPGSWPVGLQADCLRVLAVAESRQAAAHARVLSAFSRPGGGLAGDGQRSARVWLCWQTQATRRAASVRVSWMRRLGEHPVVAAALADGSVSVSWAHQVADWTDRLPAAVRDDADAELLAAAGNGASLTDLAFLADDLRRVHARPDRDDDGFEDRQVHLATTFEGAGRLSGDLTARCAAAVEAVLDSLSKPGGPEDTRSLAQRRHDALETSDAVNRQAALACAGGAGRGNAVCSS